MLVHPGSLRVLRLCVAQEARACEWRPGGRGAGSRWVDARRARTPTHARAHSRRCQGRAQHRRPLRSAPAAPPPAARLLLLDRREAAQPGTQAAGPGTAAART